MEWQVKVFQFNRELGKWQFVKSFNTESEEKAVQAFHLLEKAFNFADGTRLYADVYKNGEYWYEL